MTPGRSSAPGLTRGERCGCRAGRASQRVLGFLSLPGVAWLLALFVVPFYAIGAVAFGRSHPILRTPDPVWNPFSWDFSTMNKVLGDVFGGDLWGRGPHASRSSDCRWLCVA